jgi:hypothetical protein
MGLPGAIQLETLFDGERFVIATYTFERRHNTEHELRRLLVAKYGRPYLLADRRRHEIELEATYAEAPGVRWEVDPPMELVYTNIRAGTEKARLSYVNRALFEELERRVSEEGKKNDRARAEQLGKTF